MATLTINSPRSQFADGPPQGREGQYIVEIQKGTWFWLHRYEAVFFRLRSWFDRLDALTWLGAGWNRHNAPPPAPIAIDNARRFLRLMTDDRQEPTRLAASVVGGVGITWRSENREVYLEFYNNGTAH